MFNFSLKPKRVMKKLMYWGRSYLLPVCMLLVFGLMSCQEKEIIPLEEGDLGIDLPKGDGDWRCAPRGLRPRALHLVLLRRYFGRQRGLLGHLRPGRRRYRRQAERERKLSRCPDSPLDSNATKTAPYAAGGGASIETTSTITIMSGVVPSTTTTSYSKRSASKAFSRV